MTAIITAAELARFAPRVPVDAREDLVESLSAGMIKFGINTPTRILHAMAQFAHESDQFTIKRESGRYSASRIMQIFGVGVHSARVTQTEANRLAKLAKTDEGRALFNRVYGVGNPSKARELGNVGPDDGWNFRGTGYIQTTGRAAFAKVSKLLDHDFVESPDDLADPKWAGLAACAEWSIMKVNDVADRDDVRAVTKRVNGGYNGLSDRIAYLAKARKVWPESVLAARLAGKKNDGVVDDSEDDGLSEQQVLKIQTQLRDLGYPEIGAADGKMGDRTRSVIVAFKVAQGLKIDSSEPAAVGPDFWEALATADKREVSAGRQSATVEDLREDGSSTIKSADGVKTGAAVIGAVASIGGAGSSGVLDTAKKTADQVSGWQSVIDTLKGGIGSISSAIHQYWWIILIVAAIGAWYYAKNIQAERLRKHQSGEDVSR